MQYNVSFHANKKKIKEFNRLKNKENLLQVETPTLSTHQFNGLELMDKDPSGANALSANVVVDGRTPNSSTQAQSIDERLVQNNISSTNNTLAQNSKHIAESTINKLDFTQKAIEFINKQQTKHESKTIQQTHKKNQGR